MHVVGIYGLGQDKEPLVGPLAAAWGRTNYEALARLRTPGDGPLVVAFFASEEQAERLAARLRSAAFSALVLTPGEIEDEGRARVVSQFELGDRELLVETKKTGRLSVPFLDIELILRGTGVAVTVSTEISKNRSFSLGRAVMSGGMIISKTTKDVREVKKEEREGFIKLYAGNGPPFILMENSLAFDSLGRDRKLTRTGNFVYLTSELRQRCPNARYDERLLTRPGQISLLGPSLSPEKHLDVATALLAKALRKRN
jgi:hypothetical protein